MGRIRKDKHSLKVLEDFFEHTPKPTITELRTLSQDTKMDTVKLYNWFWHARKKSGNEKNTRSASRRRAFTWGKEISQSEAEENSRAESTALNNSLMDSLNQPSMSESSQSPDAYRPDGVAEDVDVHLGDYCNRIDYSSDDGSTNISSDALPDSSSTKILTSLNTVQRFRNDSAISVHHHENFQVSSSYKDHSQLQSPALPINSLATGYSDECSSHVLDEYLGRLAPKEEKILEKIYSNVENPSKEDISSLAARFVKEQEKEAEIIAWFAKRRVHMNKSHEMDSLKVGSPFTLHERI